MIFLRYERKFPPNFDKEKDNKIWDRQRSYNYYDKRRSHDNRDNEEEEEPEWMKGTTGINFFYFYQSHSFR